MKSFLYALKVWLTTIAGTLPAVFYISIANNDKTPAVVHIPVMIFSTVLFTLPFLLGFWLIARSQYKKDKPVMRKKIWLGVWGVLSIGLVILNFMVIEEWTWFFSLLLAFVISLIVYKLPQRKPLSVTDVLKGRHILLRVQENNLLLRGIVLSELNIWPITVKLHESSPNSTLELHSMQPDELFTSLNYQTSVKVKAFTSDRREFLFAATLELDHTLN